MMKYALLFILAGVPAVAAALADWVTSAVDERVSVQAPVPLAEVDMNRAIAGSPGAAKEQLKKLKGTKMFMGKDGAGLYMVIRMDIGYITPEVDVSRPSDRTAFYTGFINSMAEDDRGYLLEHSSFALTGLEGVDFKYTGLHPVSKKLVVKYSRALLVDKKCYSMLFLSADGGDSTGVRSSQERTRFLQSLTVKPLSNK
jgi:hypothetical protein